MKNYILTLVFSTLFIFFTTDVFSQGPPPPPSGAGHGASGNQAAGNAPIGSGLFILLGLGAAYGGKKIYETKKENDLQE